MPKQDTLLRLQTLLAERFKLVFHREKEQATWYALVLARADGWLGSQMRRSKIDCATQESAEPGPPPASDPEVGQHCAVSMSDTSLSGEGQTVRDLALFLGRPLHTVVIDRTGLTGQFDVALKWLAATSSLAADPFWIPRQWTSRNRFSLPSRSNLGCGCSPNKYLLTRSSSTMWSFPRLTNGLAAMMGRLHVMTRMMTHAN